MRLRRSVSPLWLGLTAVAVVLVAVPLALARHGSTASATVAVAPLTATDRRVLGQTRPLVEALPTAIAEIPQAASDASGHHVTVTRARAILDRTPALAPLARAIASPSTLTASLVAGYRAVMAGDRPPSPDQLAADLESLQTVEGDIGPALRLVAARGGSRLSAAGAETVVERDRALRPLARFVAAWPQVYGAFTLVEQSAAS